MAQALMPDLIRGFAYGHIAGNKQFPGEFQALFAKILQNRGVARHSILQAPFGFNRDRTGNQELEKRDMLTMKMTFIYI